MICLRCSGFKDEILDIRNWKLDYGKIQSVRTTTVLDDTLKYLNNGGYWVMVWAGQRGVDPPKRGKEVELDTSGQPTLGYTTCHIVACQAISSDIF